MSKIDRVLAVVCVANLERGTDWYTEVIGRKPDNTPVPGIHEWYFGDGGVQLLHDAERAGKSLITFLVADVAATRRDMKLKGLMLENTTMMRTLHE